MNQATGSVGFRRYAGILLVSATILSLEIIFTRIFSITIWYHFAYLVVGVALLGGGAAGAYMSLRSWDDATLSARLGRFATLFSLAIVLSLLVVTYLKFDPLEFTPGGLLRTLAGLIAYALCLFAVFLLGGLTMVCGFTLWLHSVHKVYFADLMGASIGAISVLWVIRILGGPGALILASILALSGGLLLGSERSRMWKWGTVGLACCEVLLLARISAAGWQLPVPFSKDLGWAMSIAGTGTPEYTRWNPVGRVDVLPPTAFTPPTYWIVFGGVSSAFPVPSHMMRFVTSDATSISAMHEFKGDFAPYGFLDHAIVSAAYQIGNVRPKVLNIGVGGGLDLLLAHLHHARSVTAIEINSDIIELLKGPYAEFTGRSAMGSNTRVLAAEGRSFMMRDTSSYDIIQGIGVDNFAALAGGAYVLSESYLYTVEAVEVVLSRLGPHGIFSWTRFVNDPPREMLRLTAVAAEALRRQGIADPGAHIVIVANGNVDSATLLVGKSAFERTELDSLNRWVNANGFHFLHDPSRRLSTVYSLYLADSHPREFEARYPFRISPTTDDNPFFYNYFKWSHLAFIRGGGGDKNTSLPLGNINLLVLSFSTLIAAIAFVGIPLRRYRRVGVRISHVVPVLTYFAALGLGFIMLEIVLIQRLTLFIGYPTEAMAVTIFGILAFSGLGSVLSVRICSTPSRLSMVIGLIACLVVAYAYALPPILHAFLNTPDVWRVFISLLLLAPIGTLLGMPFPTGLRIVGARSRDLVPWAWGANGVCAVVGSVAVVVLSMETTFTFSFIVAGFLYSLAMLTSHFLWIGDGVDASGEHGGLQGSA